VDLSLLITQILNGVQFGLILFLLSAGLTLVFGVLNFINLAHGAFYMLGAFLTATLTLATGSFVLGVVAAVLITGVIGVALERVIVRTLYQRDHLEQVLATFGLLLCVESSVHYFWGPSGLTVPLPDWLEGYVALGSITLPVYRVFIVAAGLLIAAGLWFVVTRTRAGMIMRASAVNRETAEALGIETRTVFAGIFGAGAVLAALAGSLIVPITGATFSMGGSIVILAFVIIIIGGMGSIRGVFLAAMIVGLIDTLGRAYLSALLATVFSATMAATAGPAIASVLIYVILGAVLAFKPEGLLPPKSR
jgi:branched-chain amino acid transport system permease protein